MQDVRFKPVGSQFHHGFLKILSNTLLVSQLYKLVHLGNLIIF